MTFTIVYGFKTFMEIQLIRRYADGFYDTYCISFHIIAHRHNIGVR